MNNNVSNRIKKRLVRAVCMLMAVLVALTMFPAGRAFAGTEKKQSKASSKTEEKAKEEPIREVHRAGVGNRLYCFFVTHNVVLTPAEIEKMDDKELSAEILKRSGLYMKEANCNKASHKEISPDAWDKDKWHIYIGEEDIEKLRMAEPVEGDPVKLHMDVRIIDKKDEEKLYKKSGEEKEGEEGEEGEEDEEEEEKLVYYSTFQRLSPRIIFIAVATEEDAALGEDICEEEKTPAKKQKKTRRDSSSGSDGGGEPEEMLPEYRTINMVDRSGGPLEETLKDGTPVTLEWVEPDMHADSEGKKSFLDHIPGRGYGLAAGVAAAAAVIAFAVTRKKRED